MSDAPRTESSAEWPRPDHAQQIWVEGCGCVVMSPEEYQALYDFAKELEREISHLNERLIAQHESDLTERESYWAAEALKARAKIIALGGNARGKVYRMCVKHETLNSTWPTILVESVPPPCPICEAAMTPEAPK